MFDNIQIRDVIMLLAHTSTASWNNNNNMEKAFTVKGV